MIYILSIGTNIGNRKENIEKVIESINLLPKTKVTKYSSIYETQPVGYDDQQNFYNICAEVESSFNPHEMLGCCLGIEAGFGRVRTIKNGPRIIDIDIILSDCGKINSENLLIPHPRYKERRFVLEPLKELYPSCSVFGNDFSGLSEKIENQDIVKL